jgi:coenzyme F420-0:L-glutamate ligase/coenzyme F420-1:gamma-L-glutamate ligase
MIGNVSLSTIPTMPDIRPKDDLALIIGNALESHGVANGDILCIAHKIISKAEGAIFTLEEIEPSIEAL